MLMQTTAQDKPHGLGLNTYFIKTILHSLNILSSENLNN